MVKSIELENGDVLTDPAEVEKYAANYFKNLFSSINPRFEHLVHDKKENDLFTIEDIVMAII